MATNLNFQENNLQSNMDVDHVYNPKVEGLTKEKDLRVEGNDILEDKQKLDELRKLILGKKVADEQRKIIENYHTGFIEPSRQNSFLAVNHHEIKAEKNQDLDSKLVFIVNPNENIILDETNLKIKLKLVNSTNNSNLADTDDKKFIPRNNFFGHLIKNIKVYKVGNSQTINNVKDDLYYRSKEYLELNCTEEYLKLNKKNLLFKYDKSKDTVTSGKRAHATDSTSELISSLDEFASLFIKTGHEFIIPLCIFDGFFESSSPINRRYNWRIEINLNNNVPYLFESIKKDINGEGKTPKVNLKVVGTPELLITSVRTSTEFKNTLESGFQDPKLGGLYLSRFFDYKHEEHELTKTTLFVQENIGDNVQIQPTFIQFMLIPVSDYSHESVYDNSQVNLFLSKIKKFKLHNIANGTGRVDFEYDSEDDNHKQLLYHHYLAYQNGGTESTYSNKKLFKIRDTKNLLTFDEYFKDKNTYAKFVIDLRQDGGLVQDLLPVKKQNAGLKCNITFKSALDKNFRLIIQQIYEANYTITSGNDGIQLFSYNPKYMKD